MFGGFGSFSYQGFNIDAEVDFKKDKGVLGTNEFISYLEINYLVLSGIDLKFMYDFYDPDTEYTTGSESRYSLGLEFFPLYGIELRPIYRFIVQTPGNINRNEFDFLFHFYL
jgi:hypothetical protein